VRRPLKGVNRTTAYISKSCGGPHIVSILMIDTTCLTLNNIVTLKSGLEVTQGHSDWEHLQAWMRFPIHLP